MVGCLLWTEVVTGLVGLIILLFISWSAAWAVLAITTWVTGLCLKSGLLGLGPGCSVPTEMFGLMVAWFEMRSQAFLVEGLGCLLRFLALAGFAGLRGTWICFVGLGLKDPGFISLSRSLCRLCREVSFGELLQLFRRLNLYIWEWITLMWSAMLAELLLVSYLIGRMSFWLTEICW